MWEARLCIWKDVDDIKSNEWLACSSVLIPRKRVSVFAAGYTGKSRALTVRVGNYGICNPIPLESWMLKQAKAVLKSSLCWIRSVRVIYQKKKKKEINVFSACLTAILLVAVRSDDSNEQNDLWPVFTLATVAANLPPAMVTWSKFEHLAIGTNLRRL